MPKKTQIVILGAGYGGVHAAKKLAKRYKKDDNIEITLIDRNPYHTLMTSLHEIAGGRVDTDAVKVDLRKIFNKTKVDVVTEDIVKVDVKNNVLKSEYGEYHFDYLIVGTGSEPAFFGVPGVKENGFSLWSLEDAVKIHDHIENMFKKASRERNEKKRKAMLTFIVAGGGFTGIETVGEIMEWKTTLSRDYNVDESEVRLMVVEALPSILNMLDKPSVEKAENYMKKKNIELHKNSPIIQVDPDFIKLKDGTEIPTNTLIWTCGVQGNEEAASIGVDMGKRGRLQANEYMQSTSNENVYIVGDIAYYEETNSKGIPQIVETAMQTADTIVDNISADMEHKEKVKFKSNYHGFMVSIGGRYGVAHVGGMKLTGFFAMAMKHLVDMHYLFGIGGFNLIFKYLNHEFFSIKEKRSIMGGHLAAKSSTLWLVVLRLFVGIMWLIEGIGKIQQGWLKADHIYIVKTAAASGASEAASNTAQQAAAQAVPLLSQPPEFFNSFMNTFVAPYAHFFQVCVVLGEVALGLALIGGFLTFLCSLASIFLCINFILSAMAGKEILWYIFASITLMGGSGRAFGLDYYIQPAISKWWNNLRRGKQVPIYKQNSIGM